MPLYEYKCAACSKMFEAYVSSYKEQQKPQPCPDCQALSPYAGLSQVRVGQEGYFGVITDDGQRHRGHLRY